MILQGAHLWRVSGHTASGVDRRHTTRPRLVVIVRTHGKAEWRVLTVCQDDLGGAQELLKLLLAADFDGGHDYSEGEAGSLARMCAVKELDRQQVNEARQ
jgi:hypothetical protein